MDRVVLGLILIVFLYLLFYTNEISESNSFTTVYMCPQSPSNSKKGYFQVNFNEQFQFSYRRACKSDDLLLIYILSNIEHFYRRDFIRQTWANKYRYEQLLRTCFVFLVGQTTDPTINSKFLFEVYHYSDIVQLNINETYQNIVYKEVGGLKWSHMYASHVPYLFKIDDDTMIDSLLLSDIARFFVEHRIDHSEYIQRQTKFREFIEQIEKVDKFTLFKGVAIEGKRIVREGKFGLHHVAWNHDLFPAYCRGIGYMFSSFVRDRLYRASMCYATEYVPWAGDLFVTGSLASAAAVRCSKWIIESIEISDSCSLHYERQPRLLVCSISMYMQGYSLEEYEQSWRMILQRHQVTNRTIEEAKRKRLELQLEEFEEKELEEQSIVEQMENRTNRNGKPIVPMRLSKERLHED